MVFSSNIFLFLYLPLVLLVYYASPVRWRNFVLLAVSLVFYGWGEPVYIFLMGFTIVLNYISGLLITLSRNRGGSGRAVLIISVLLDLSLLFYFKYAGFFVRTLRLLPVFRSVRIPEIVLPIGISFYIFQSMSYTIDVFRGDAAAQRSLVSFGAYVSMFPQLIAGPIVRYSDVACQLENRKENFHDFASGVRLFVKGLSKKVLLANTLGAMWQALIPESGTFAAWSGLTAYAMQIYFDFSGYSDMAIGLGRMFGFEFLKNFDHPYVSMSVSEFWRRWHISLSTWFREYVYFPLGGNRRGLPRQILNVFIVWSLTGLWHGASWNYVLWGLYSALFIALEKIFLLRYTEKLPGLVRRCLFLFVICLSWVLFYFEDTSELLLYYGKLFTLSSTGVHARNVIRAYLPVWLAGVAACVPVGQRLMDRLEEKRGGWIVSGAIYAGLLLLCIASLTAGSYNPFIYFRF